MAVANAIVFGEVGGGFGRGKDVVGLEGVLGCGEGDGVDCVSEGGEVVYGGAPGGLEGSVEFAQIVFLGVY